MELSLSPSPSSSLKESLRRILLDLLRMPEMRSSEEGPACRDMTDAKAELLAWFDPLGITTETKTVHVLFPHIFFQTWFEYRGRRWLEMAVDRLLGPNFKVVYGLFDPRKDPPSLSFSHAADQKKREENSPEISSFDTFFVSAKNQFSLKILQETALGNKKYNPLFLKGLSGTGKTHLLHATASTLAASSSTAIKKTDLELKSLAAKGEGVCCLSAADFAAFFRQPPHLQDSIRAELRALSAFCMDDIHQLAGHLHAQKELAELIDILVSQGSPVICTSLAFAAVSADDLSPFLLARLSMGIVLELAEPDLDVRLRYAQSQLAAQNIQTNREIPLLLARRCTDLRHLRGVITRMSAFRAHSGQLPDDNDLDTILHASGNMHALTPEALLALVAAHCGFSPKDLRGKKRDPKLVLTRQIAMYLCRELLGESYPSLGKIFGGKDHSTVMYSVKKIREIQVTNKDVHILVTELTKSCQKNLL